MRSPLPVAKKPSDDWPCTRSVIGEPAPSVTFLIGAGRAGFRGGFDPGPSRGDPAVRARRRRHDAGHSCRCARRRRSGSRRPFAPKSRQPGRVRRPQRSPPPTVEALARLLEAGVRAHTETLLRIAPLLAPFGGLVPQTRVRIRATGSANYGRSIPIYPEEWGGGTALPDDRDLRDAWPEGVTLPRAIVYNLGCTTLGLPAVTSDLAVLDRRAAVLLERHVPGYREIIASELPYFVKEAAALVFGRKLAETTARRCLRAAAALWVDARTREELVAPTCLFAMQYLRYVAEDSESWDETKEHESRTTREEELIRETSSVAFAALCAERPGDRWPVLQITRRRRGRVAPAPRPRADDRGEARVRRPADRGLAADARRTPSPGNCDASGRGCVNFARTTDARRDRAPRRARETAGQPGRVARRPPGRRD